MDLRTFIILTLLGVSGHMTHARSVTVIPVPHTAREGHIVTKIPPNGHINHILDTDTSSLRPGLFSVLNQGEVMVTQDLSHLANHLLVLKIDYTVPTHEPMELRVLVRSDAQLPQFTESPYQGHVTVGETKGTKIQGLEPFNAAVQKYKLSQITIENGRSDLFGFRANEDGSVTLLTKVSPGDSSSATYKLLVSALDNKSHTKLYTFIVVHMVSKRPAFDREIYEASMALNKAEEPILNVRAKSQDGRPVSYHMDLNPQFELDRYTGDIRARNPEFLFPKSYFLEVFAVGENGMRSKPVSVHIEVPSREVFMLDTHLRRRKRATLEDMVFVVQENHTVAQPSMDLFTVARETHTPNHRYTLKNDDSGKLQVNFNTGMVSVKTGENLIGLTKINLEVNITREDDAQVQDDQPVRVNVVQRGFYSRVFKNLPVPLTTTIEQWMYPGTPVFQFTPVDREDYNARVQCRIESGAAGRFSMDPDTCILTTVGRQPFPVDGNFTIAVSAPNVGAALSRFTFSEALHVMVMDLSPQFYENPQVINIPEDQAVGQIGTIQTKSFQDLTVTLSATQEVDNPATRDYFSINSATGVVSLNTGLRYAEHPRQYRYIVTAKEEYSNFESRCLLIINLLPVNRNSPYFAPVMYVVQDIRENTAVGTSILDVSATDIDQGQDGQVNFSVSDDHFRVTTTNNKNGSIVINRALDYEALPGGHYEFILTATDRGNPPRSGSTTVRVWVTNVNDNAPKIVPDVLTVKLNNERTPPKLVHVVQAFDPDGGSAPKIYFKGGADRRDPFSIDPDTGTITLSQNLGTDIPGYTLELEARDNNDCCGGLTTNPGNGEGTLYIELTGANHPPRFPNCQQYNGKIAEMSPKHTPVINVTAEDPDVGVNGELTYSVVYQPHITTNQFGINTYNKKIGEVYSLLVFDREDPPGGNPRLGITVEAMDGGDMSARCFFFIDITDINDNRPMFDDSQYETTIANNHGMGTSVIEVFAIDDDEGENATVSYSITSQNKACSGDQNCFAITDSSRGVISLRNPVPSTFTGPIEMTVMAQDNGRPNRLNSTVTCTVTIVTPDNPLPPRWNANSVSVESYPENITRNTVVKTTKAAPGHAGATEVIYNLYQGRTPQENRNEDFRFETTDTNSMDVNVYKDLDFETTPQYILKLRATNKEVAVNALYTDTRFQLNLEDVNDQIPNFVGQDSKGRFSASLPEDSAIGSTVLFVSAIDEDGTSPNNLVTYAFDPQNGVNIPNFSNLFELNRNTGLITTKALFNDQVGTPYIFNVIAEDGAPSARPGTYPQHNRVTVSVTVQVTGLSMNPPTFTATPAPIQIEEDQPFNTTVATITATIPENNITPVTQYSIIGGNEDRAFGVELNTGRIYTMGRILHSRKEQYILRYRVFDGIVGQETNITINIVSVNRRPPKFTPLTISSSSFVEMSSTGPVGQVTATDPDTTRCSDSNIRYSLEGVLKGPFSINNRDVSVSQALDRDYPNGHAKWVINVQGEDEQNCNVPNPNPRKGYGMVIVEPQDINDNSPIFDTCCIVGSVPENSGVGVSVMDVTAFDYDFGENASIVYTSLEHVDPVLPQALFQINRSTGRVTTTVANSLDREAQNQYLVRVVAADQGQPPRSTSQLVTINIADVNDHQPVFVQSEYNVSIEEEDPIGSYVLDVSATDADIFENAYRDYIVQSSPEFYADSIRSSGAGTIKNARRLDYDTMVTKTFTFPVQVQHPTESGHSSTSTVTVTVTDINDNAPQFNPRMTTVQLWENATVGTYVSQFTATDIDSGINKEFGYSIDYQHTDPKKQFNVDQNGVVTVRAQLDRETQAVHTVHVLAIDKGTPPQTGTGTLTVQLKDVNDNLPDFRETYNIQVPKNPGAGTDIGSFLAKDIDLPENGPPFDFTLECAGDSACDAFEVRVSRDGTGDGTRGTVVTKKSTYIRTDRKYYELTIRMKDNPTSGQSSMQGSRTLRVTVQGENDNDQRPGFKDVMVYNYNGRLPDSLLGNVHAEDPDDWDRGDKEFTLITETRWFAVHQNGSLEMKEGAPKGITELEAEVYDRVRNVRVRSQIRVNNFYIEDDAVFSSGSARLSDITAEEFVDRPKTGNGIQDYGPSKLDLFKRELVKLLNTREENIHVFSVMNVRGKTRMVDIRYAAHGSPYYRQAKLDGILWMNRNQVNQAAGINIVMAPVNLCEETTCWDSGCSNEYTVTHDPLLVNTNGTSMVGVTAYITATCTCAAQDFSRPLSCSPNPCMNNGTCSTTPTGFTCTCPEGYTGAQCQQTHISFQGNGWGWVEPFGQCEDGRTSFEFMTQVENGVLLYHGPMSQPSGQPDFLSVDLVAGYPRVMFNMGDGILSMILDGMNSQGQRKLPKLNDGRWHTLDLTKQGKTMTLTIDYCAVSDITEGIETTTEDRKACEVSRTSNGENFLYNIPFPVQVGGRQTPAMTYPPGLQQQGFNGCIKNLQHNGQLIDLEMGTIGQSQNSDVGCPREETVCDGACPGNSTCIGNLAGDPVVCRCRRGFTGPNCDIVASEKDFGQSSFIEWKFKNAFYNQLSNRVGSFMLTFRTRQTNGMLFTGSNYNKMEHIKLEVADSKLQVRYDFGGGDQIVALNGVNASSGNWHQVEVIRQSSVVTLKMDSGEGRFISQSVPKPTSFRTLALAQDGIFGGGDVRYQKYSNKPLITDDYVNSCMADVRYNDNLFPWDQSQNFDAAEVNRMQNLQDNCHSDACQGVQCTSPTECRDLWRAAECVCPANMTVAPPPAVCTYIMDCSIPRCVNGYCSMSGGSYFCHCDPGWTGEHCDALLGGAQPYAALSTGGTIAIVACLLALLLLILLVIIFVRRREKEKPLLINPDEDVRDNVVCYDEEGAGEEDYHAFDLSRLQKPIYPDETEGINQAFTPDVVRREERPLNKAEPEHRFPRDGPGPSNIGEFIGGRMGDADDDPNAPPYDSVREFDYEGVGSSAGSLSSLATSSSGGDQDYDYLNSYGPKFRKLADMYGGGDDESESSV